MSTDNYTPKFEDATFEEPKTSIPVHEGSALDVLKKAVKQETKIEDLVIRIPNRPVLRAVFSTYIDGEKFQMWQRRCTNKKTDTMDVLKFSCIILANQLKGVEAELRNKFTEVIGENGEPMTFQNPEFREMFADSSVARETSALVRKFFGNDGTVISAAREVLEASGYGDEADEFEVDPTGV